MSSVSCNTGWQSLVPFPDCTVDHLLVNTVPFFDTMAQLFQVLYPTITSPHAWLLKFNVLVSLQLNCLQHIQNALARAVVAAPRFSNLDHILKGCIGSRYKNALNTKLFPPHTSSSSLLLHVTCAILLQSSLLDLLYHPHWSLFSKG